MHFTKLTPLEGGRDAADVMFCMHMTRTCLENKDATISFVVVSKDKLLHTCGQMHAHLYDVEAVTLTNGWTDLKMWLE